MLHLYVCMGMCDCNHACYMGQNIGYDFTTTRQNFYTHRAGHGMNQESHAWHCTRRNIGEEST